MFFRTWGQFSKDKPWQNSKLEDAFSVFCVLSYFHLMLHCLKKSLLNLLIIWRTDLLVVAAFEGMTRWAIPWHSPCAPCVSSYLVIFNVYLSDLNTPWYMWSLKVSISFIVFFRYVKIFQNVDLSSNFYFRWVHIHDEILALN